MKKLGVRLPAEYAAFLRAGGPTEGGTLLTLEQALAHDTLRLAEPFPFTKAHAKKILAQRKKDKNAFLEPEDTVGGVLPIADGGCNDITYLVLTGPLRGSIWSGGEPGWLPHARADGTLLGFREWLDTVADEPKTKKTRSASKKKPPSIALDSYQLNLRGQGLTAVPDEVFAMTKVAMMYLGGNELTELSPSFAKLGNTLHALELGPNPLARLDGVVLAKLGKLTHLDLHGTQLERLPKEIAKLPIERLELSDNPSLDIDEALTILRPLKTLRWLSLARCKLDAVPRGIAALPQLRRVYLHGNMITKLPATLPKLEVLGLLDNRIDTIPDTLEPLVQNVYFAGNPGARKEKKRFDAIRRGFVMLG